MAREAFVECPLAHPTLMLRRSVLERYRYRDVPWPEDYDLVLRLLERGEQLGSVPERLLHWRDGPSRLSRSSARYCIAAFTQCKAEYLARGFLDATDRYLLWGYGDTGKALAAALAKRGKHPSAIVELHPGRLGQLIRGVRVVAPGALLELPRRPLLVSVAGLTRAAKSAPRWPKLASKNSATSSAAPNCSTAPTNNDTDRANRPPSRSSPAARAPTRSSSSGSRRRRRRCRAGRCCWSRPPGSCLPRSRGPKRGRPRCRWRLCWCRCCLARAAEPAPAGCRRAGVERADADGRRPRLLLLPVPASSASALARAIELRLGLGDRPRDVHEPRIARARAPSSPHVDRGSFGSGVSNTIAPPSIWKVRPSSVTAPRRAGKIDAAGDADTDAKPTIGSPVMECRLLAA